MASSTTSKNSFFSSLFLRIVLFVIAMLLYLLCPSEPVFSSHWSDNVPCLNRFALFSLRQMCIGPVCWGAALFLVLGCGNVWLKRRGVFTCISRTMRVTFAVLSCLILLAGTYWTWGFIGYSILPPMPFNIGWYIMEHRVVLGIWWSIFAFSLHLSSLCVGTQSSAIQDS